MLRLRLFHYLSGLMLKLIAKVSHFAADWVAAEVVAVAVALAVVKQIGMNGI